jgi:acetylornithine aminotransferase
MRRVPDRVQKALAYSLGNLGELRASARAQGRTLIDLGMGEPREPVSPAVGEALAAAIPERSGYPRTGGIEPLRQAIAAWAGRRYGIDLDPAAQIIPTAGSKEAIFSLALIAVDADAGRDVVVTTTPGYPIPAAGGRYAGARVLELPLLEANRFLPDLDAIDDETWSRIALFWVNYPNNPTGAAADPAFLAGLAARAREHGFLLCSDEAYSELWRSAPPASALALEDLTNVLTFGSLSKRAAMAGYRSGFVAGDPEAIALLRAFRTQTGTTAPEFVQRAAAVAWLDDATPARLREIFGRRRAVLAGALQRAGFRCGGELSLFIWAAVPDGETSSSVAEALLARDVLVAPGDMFGAAGAGYVRLAVVAADEEIERAAAIIESLTAQPVDSSRSASSSGTGGLNR